ncbi:uncharacterized protein crybg2 isoform X2 [Mugil cephalus]|uniref:uncharacterized protein crybg2 isoform X2 n=1 Tax=Mugil cephalus TaxID=48193 RepID=UPI001FB6EBAA|nr:uncharacterized protein crybg2 isoform X2 [Mugil cephalus]
MRSSSSVVEPGSTPGDAGVDTDGVVADNKRSTIYATAPRAKGKEFSYSELDLRKPKKFATFSFGLKKRKKKYEDYISRSTYVLHSPGVEEQEESAMDLSQVEVDETNAKRKFTMSQPELDSGNTFDIPSPPPLSANQVFDSPNQFQASVIVNAQVESQEPQTNGSDRLDVHTERLKAPIASIPELTLDDPGSLEENENIPVCDKLPESDAKSIPPTTQTDTSSVVNTPVLPPSQPLVALNTSDHKAAAVSSVYATNNPCDEDTFPQSDESTTVTLSYHQPDAPDTTDGTISNSVCSQDSTTVTESALESAVSADAATIHHEASISHAERSVPESAKSVATTSAVTDEASSRPVSQAAVYGALYDSLFPQSFTSEVMSMISHPSPQIRTEVRHLDAKTEPEPQTETISLYSRVSNSHDSNAYRINNTESGDALLNEKQAISSSESSRFTSYQTSSDSYLQSNRPSSLVSYSKPVDSKGIPYSELARPHLEEKSDSSGLVHDIVRPVPVCEESAPPVSVYVTSQETDAQVTGSKRRVILVKELVSDEASADPGSSSPVPDKMSTAKGLVIKTEAVEVFPEPPRQTAECDRALSPAYLSVGSDDGSAMELYYSAEEDNSAQESGDEEMFTVDEREATFVVDGGKEVGLREELQQHGEGSGLGWRDEVDLRGLITEMENKGEKMGNEGKIDDWSGPAELQQQLGGQKSEAQVHKTGTLEFLETSEASESLDEGDAVTLWRQVTETEREEGREKERLATPVQQVNTLVECDFAPPSGELHGQGGAPGGTWTMDLEREDPSCEEKQLPVQLAHYLTSKDILSDDIHSSDIREEAGITPTCTETEEQVQLTEDRIGETSKEGIQIVTKNTSTDTSGSGEVGSCNLTHIATLQCDATDTDNNRAPRSSVWADTISQNLERNGTTPEQVAVELSALNAHALRPDKEAAEALSQSHEHPEEDQPDLDQGSLTASGTTTEASESPQTKGKQESVAKMNTSYSSLNTTLNTSPLREDESRQRYRKLSLINEADDTDVSQDTVDFAKTSSAGTDYTWRNRFEGVTQYKPSKMDDSSFLDSLSYRVSDSSSSSYSLSSSSSFALPEATAYTSNTYSSSSSPSLEEPSTLGNRLSDRAEVYLSRESEPARDAREEWRRRSLVEQVELGAPAGDIDRQAGKESERIKSHWDTETFRAPGFTSTLLSSYDSTDHFEDDESSRFTGVFQATRVELVSDGALPLCTPPASPDKESPIQFEMDSLVDTLKNMGPSMRPRTTGLRAPPPTLISSLPPIVEDAPSPFPSGVTAAPNSPTKKMEGTSAESPNGLYTLPADIGLKRSAPRDVRSPLELLKQSQDQQEIRTRNLSLPLRASTANSIVMRKDSSPEDAQSPVLNGNGASPTSAQSSRLDNSFLFGNYRSTSVDQTQDNGKTHLPIFRTSSLPERGLSNDRLSAGLKEPSDLTTGTDPPASRFERFSFLLNSPGSGAEDLNTRMSQAPSMSIGSPSSHNSPTRLLSPTGSIDLHRPYTPTDSPLSMFGQTVGMGLGAGTGTVGAPILQRSLSSDGTMGVQTSLFGSVHGGSQFQSQEPDRNLVSKYRAFPDAYRTKEKEHGKLNPRPGKMYIFDRPGLCGQRIEIRSDVVDATEWELQETISIRVVRGGWVLYEKPNFKGEKIALDEGDIELTYPFSPPEEQLQNGQGSGEEAQDGETSEEQAETKPARRFIVGSVRRAVRDYSVPDISLFPEENAEGKKVIFRDTSEDARIFGFPIKANSIIINAGLWLVYAEPFFQGAPRVLEVGGYSNPAAWGVEKPYVGSLHPLKVGEPRVENMTEPKVVIYDKPYFTGKSRTITTNMRDFMTRRDKQQTAFMYSAGSIKVVGGIWVGYEKEGFRGHQYLLEEGEYHDWRVWGGCDAELRSLRVIRADLTDPMMVMFEQPEEDQEGMQEENTFEVTEAIADVELFGYKTSTRSIHVLSGAWIAYSHVDFSGHQYILEKGFYNNCADWGSQDTRICSVQPILLAPSEEQKSKNEVILYSEPDFQGQCHVFDRNEEAVPEKLLCKSCRVSGGSWVLYEDKQYSGNMYVLSDGDYPTLTSMGCPPGSTIRSLKVVPTMFSVPSISLFGLECLEGREITTDTEILSLVEEGFNNHILSVRVNSGCWVICEHSNYRGRQILLEPIEITNWPKFSSMHTIGSMYPVRQKRQFFRVKNKDSGHFMSVQGGVEEMKSGRVVVTPEAEPMSDIWFYQEGLIKSKMSPTMSLQVMGNVEPGSKVVLWTENRQPVQTWTAHMRGRITNLTFPGMVLDVKGGKTYDKDHVVVMSENDERPSQQWEIELL